jgi:hypothetical protein
MLIDQGTYQVFSIIIANIVYIVYILLSFRIRRKIELVLFEAISIIFSTVISLYGLRILIIIIYSMIFKIDLALLLAREASGTMSIMFLFSSLSLILMGINEIIRKFRDIKYK